MDNNENDPQIPVNSFEINNESHSNNMETEDDEDEDNTIFSNKSIAVTASSMGISNLSDDVCKRISEEVYFKTKELIFMSKLILNQNRSNILTTNDMKKAMKLLGGVELYGHNSKDDVNYVYIPKADVYVEDDPDIDIMFEGISDNIFNSKAEPRMAGAWILPEGYADDPSNLTACSYYQKIAKTILTGSPAVVKIALSDLRANPKIGPVCPYLLNLVALTVRKMTRDTHLTNTLIGTVSAIAHNKFVDPSPFLAVNRSVNSLLKIVIENNIEKRDDHFADTDDDLTVRIRAALLLAEVVTMWSVDLKQQIDIVKHLLQHLLDPEVPLQSHYGALFALIGLGYKRPDFCFWSVIERYLPQLETKIESKKCDVMVKHIMCALLIATRCTLRTEKKIDLMNLELLRDIDIVLYSFFGDSVTPFRLLASPPVFKCVNKSKVEQNGLKLKICVKRPFEPNENWDLCSLLDNKRRIIPLLNVHPLDYKSHLYLCVQRNNKFCQPSYKRSASGDLFINL